ncbi:MAG: hypothetical protein HKL80_07495 [Acidimicrobiales bacterium]|nr:hypothetical protein [Acidimicrobiales bacterium]
MTEDRFVSISSSQTIHPDEIARRSFAIVKKGFDPNGVRAFLEQIALEITHLIDRERRSRQQLLEAQEMALIKPPVDEDTLTAALGQETARILSSAREAARDLLARTGSEVQELKEKSEKVLAERTREAEIAAEVILKKAQADSQALIEAGKQEAESLLEAVRSDCKLMVREAQDARARILADLVRKRRTLNIQVEQLTTGKSLIWDALSSIRDQVDNLGHSLDHIEKEAKYAAEQAGLRASLDDDPTEETLIESANLLPAVALDLDSAKLTTISGESTTSSTTVQAPKITTIPRDNLKIEISEAATIAERLASEPIASVTFDPAAPEITENIRILGSTKEPDLNKDGSNLEEPVIDEVADENASDKAGQDAVDELFKRLKEGQHGSTNPSNESVQEETVEADEVSVEVSKDELDGKIENENPADETSLLGTEQFIVRRDEIITPIVAGMVRKLKRAMSDEQNELLDGVRRSGTSAHLEEILPRTQQEQRYVDVASSFLEEARAAGITFGGELCLSMGVNKIDPQNGTPVDTLALDLASLLSGGLRSKMGWDFPPQDDDAEALLVERLSATYREWKGNSLNQLVTDQVMGAFNSGEVSVLPPGTTLVWVVDQKEGTCPDCEDNHISEGTKVGDLWPTGVMFPPSHGGCRCLLVPSIA